MHGFVIDTPTGGVTLPFLMKLFVQLLAVGSELLELWVDWDHQERVKIRVESQMNTSCV